jgi:hypothetical protein
VDPRAKIKVVLLSRCLVNSSAFKDIPRVFMFLVKDTSEECIRMDSWIDKSEVDRILPDSNVDSNEGGEQRREARMTVKGSHDSQASIEFKGA